MNSHDKLFWGLVQQTLLDSHAAQGAADSEIKRTWEPIELACTYGFVYQIKESKRSDAVAPRGIATLQARRPVSCVGKISRCRIRLAV